MLEARSETYDKRKNHGETLDMEADRIDADEVVEMFVWIAQWDPALMKALIVVFLKSTRAKHAFRYCQVGEEELVGLHEGHGLVARMMGPTRQGRSWYTRFPGLRKLRPVSPRIVEMGRIAPSVRKVLLALLRSLVGELEDVCPERQETGAGEERVP